MLNIMQETWLFMVDLSYENQTEGEKDSYIRAPLTPAEKQYTILTIMMGW